jgi:DNA-binding CsgD family transcriptional regulator/tetratricopeptide (TPR) repeat protein
MAVRVTAPTFATAPRLLERERHLATLADLLDGATRGAGRLAVVRGDAGAGKTALLRAFLDDVPAAVDTAIGYCDSIATPRPLSPVHDLARSLGNGLGSLLQRSAPREEIRDHLIQRFEARPVVLAIEDVQWADDATIDLIKLLARRIGETSALLLLTYREEPRPSPGIARLLGQLATSPGATQIEVLPLSRSAMSLMTAGTSVNPDTLYRLTSGNPFFASEILAADGLALPRSIRDLIRGRLAELDERARSAIDAAAILGSRIEPWLLAAVAGETLPGIDDAIAAGLVLRDGDGLSFRHELARFAVLEDLAVIRAIGLHRSALIALRRAGIADAARLAHHAEGAADGVAVLEFAPLAAEQALDNGAYREAIAQLRRSLRFATPTDDRRVDLLEKLGDAEMVVANGVAADEAWTEALAIRRARGDQPQLVGDLVRRIARSAMWRADFSRAMAFAREAVAILMPVGESHELGMAFVGLSGQLMMESHSEEAIELGERALAMADKLGDDEVRALALNYIGAAEVGLGQEKGLDKLERSVAIARANGLASAVYRGLFNLAASAAVLQQLHRSEGYFDELTRFSASSEVISCNIDANRAEVQLMLGRWAEADASASDALQAVDDSLDPLDAATATLVLARLRTRRGQAGAEALLDEAGELMLGTNDLARTWMLVSARVESAWLAGDLGSMVLQLGRLLDKAVESRDPWLTGEIARWLQRADATPKVLSHVAEPHRLSLEGDWRSSATAWKERDNPYEAALALLDADEPTALREAHDILLGLGAHGVLPIAVQRLRASGAPVPRGPRQSTIAHAALLTEREAEIADLVAVGLSNREIAERLVLSEKTVGHHVSAVIGKLGVRRRGEVSARLAADDTPDHRGIPRPS